MIKRKITAAFLALGVSASLLLQVPVTAAEENTEEATEQTQADTAAITTNAIPGWPQGGDVSSAAAMVMEASTNTVLYSKNADQALYPSAAVKVMTTLVALENSELSDQVTMTATGVSGVTDGGVSIAAQLDETFTMEQCLYAVMVASANDISLQVAEHIGGSVEAFVEKMNARAAELGCTNTVFTNPTGLPDENQHTTAHDMTLIMKAAMSNDTFRSIVRAPSYTIPATNVSGGERVLTNKFTMIDSTSDAYYGSCLGGKEGFTSASGSVLVTAAEKNGMMLICVVMNGASGATDDDAIGLLNYGFDNFGRLTLPDEDFNRISGGVVVVPNGAVAEHLTAEDTLKGEEISRQYLFGGTPVGTALLEDDKVVEGNEVSNGQAHIKEAKDFTEAHTDIPYYIIGGLGLSLLLFFLFLIVHIAKS